MEYDPKLAKIFIANYDEAYRAAKLLVLSINRVKPLMPLTQVSIIKASDDDKDKLDAFRVRFCDLQDLLGNKIFKMILKLEEEKIGSQLDVLNMMDKRRIIEDISQWRKFRDIRNLFSHDYPENDGERAEALNLAYNNSPILVKILERVGKYSIEKIGLPSERLEVLRIE